MLNAVELFAGAGGLALGVSLAGFKPRAVVEWDRWAVDTLRENRDRGFPLLADYPIVHADVRSVDFEAIGESIDLVSGGPPCQPFSMGGKHRAFADDRDMFPAAVDVVRRLRPRAFIIENVKGITRSSFTNYLQYIELQFRCPEIVKGVDESWQDHCVRLQREHIGSTGGLRYNLVRTLVNAADYGIPQRRERVFLVGFRADLGIEWNFPEPTHSLDALLVDQWVTREYWERRAISPGAAVADAYRADPARLENLRRRNDRSGLRQPWRTVRDALQDLPEPLPNGHGNWHNHKLQHGARRYQGHTGSPMDLPAKALKAGDHGVPGGENMMVKDDGSVRYFSVRESARIQTFPDSFVFHGAWSETMRQLGNAVPVALAQLVASEVAQCLLRADYKNLIVEHTNASLRH